MVVTHALPSPALTCLTLRLLPAAIQQSRRTFAGSWAGPRWSRQYVLLRAAVMWWVHGARTAPAMSRTSLHHV
eukprot:14810090-Alexandrium_andersonii.AAC.1